MSESLFRGVCDGGEIMEVRFIGLADRCCDEARSCIYGPVGFAVGGLDR